MPTTFANPPTPVADRRPNAFSGAEEPGLDELYLDPTLHALLRRDGLDLADLRAFVTDTQKRLLDAA